MAEPEEMLAEVLQFEHQQRADHHAASGRGEHVAFQEASSLVPRAEHSSRVEQMIEEHSGAEGKLSVLLLLLLRRQVQRMFVVQQVSLRAVTMEKLSGEKWGSSPAAELEVHESSSVHQQWVES